MILQPVQPVDIAEAIARLPEAMQALAFRLLDKDEAIAETGEVLEDLVAEVKVELAEEEAEPGFEES